MSEHLYAHDHIFGQDQRRPGEIRTLAVFALTSVTMGVEIAAGMMTGSMALLADGLHMGSHALALGINALAYWYARRHAHDRAFSFGTGKVNALGGYTGALLLAGFSASMAFESVERLANPMRIAFDYAIVVAIIGLLVNGLSVLILGDHHHGHHHGHDHDDHPGHHHYEHDHRHAHAHDNSHHAAHQHSLSGNGSPAQHDHNLRSAYLHVLADALTSVLAIVALLAGKYWGTHWMDPMMGIVGALLVARWSMTLLRDTSDTLLDKQAPEAVLEAIRQSLAQEGDQIVDLHVWSVGPGLLALEATILTPRGTTAAQLKQRIPTSARVIHSTLEVHPK